MTILLTKREAAVLLGVSTRQVDRWCAARRLRFSLLGSRKRFDPDELKRFVASRSFGHRADLSSPARTI